jgi:hypothetical protein
VSLLVVMNKLRLSSYLQLLAVSLASSCDQPQIKFSARAPAIEGTYVADTYYNKLGVGGFYPIQGQTMTLRLISVSDDSIRVEIKATPNGDYSPGSNRLYDKVLVDQEIDSYIDNKKQINCITYAIKLPTNSGQPSEGELLRRRCGKAEIIDYHFLTPVSKVEATVQFIKR